MAHSHSPPKMTTDAAWDSLASFESFFLLAEPLRRKKVCFEILTWAAAPPQRGRHCSSNLPQCCLCHHINEVTVIMSHLISPQWDSPSFSFLASCCCHLAPGGGGKGEKHKPDLKAPDWPRAVCMWFCCFLRGTGWGVYFIRQRKNCQEIQMFAGMFSKLKLFQVMQNTHIWLLRLSLSPLNLL